MKRRQFLTALAALFPMTQGYATHQPLLDELTIWLREIAFPHHLLKPLRGVPLRNRTVTDYYHTLVDRNGWMFRVWLSEGLTQVAPNLVQGQWTATPINSTRLPVTTTFTFSLQEVVDAQSPRFYVSGRVREAYWMLQDQLGRFKFLQDQS